MRIESIYHPLWLNRSLHNP